ncbi:ABC transporter [Halothiobacillus diazotrophicus]|uniref:ABC transporter n=1 Tax=Halothiobacillus diazotrophicus TaxID=1860122 RepID=A0A191ZHN0_9GAMM|nr:ATP-binding cassette domain-containing protein [Halothiobacillus diazotrophicus]ANJ67353.1 ABC transporter [Halothiobacillus diazotrophicus]
MPSEVVNPVIRAERVSKVVAGPVGATDDSPKTLTILHEVDLEIAPGEAVAIVGPSGAGKSTLLALLAGLDRASTGRITLAGFDLDDRDEDGRAAVRAGRVGFVFQSFQLIDGLTALENVALPLELNGIAAAEDRARNALTEVGLAQRLSHQPRQLSGGEQQRVALARAFAGTPDILFADEPTGSLDTATGDQVIDLLFELRDRHATTLVLVTHDPALARRCDRRYEIRGGRIRTLGASDGTPTTDAEPAA